jgi:adenosine deaminase
MARVAVALRDDEGLPVVGFDLAGEESGFPAAYHTSAYQYAHSHFLKTTVHAGEAYGPESIFQAITDCHANRIGHGTFLFSGHLIQDSSIEDPDRYVAQLVDYVASQRIAVEVCLTSNLQTTPSLQSIADHPLQKMIEHNLSVSICTDNRLVSNTSVSRELELVAGNLAITPHQFKNLITSGFKGSFFPAGYTRKREYVRRFQKLYDALEREAFGAATG